MAATGKLEKFGQSVTKDYQKRLTTDNDGGAVAAPVVDWGSIIDMVITIVVPIIKECLAKRSAGQVAEARSMGFLARARLNIDVHRQMREEYRRPRDVRAATRHMVDAIVERARGTDEEEALAIIAEADSI